MELLCWQWSFSDSTDRRQALGDRSNFGWVNPNFDSWVMGRCTLAPGSPWPLKLCILSIYCSDYNRYKWKLPSAYSSSKMVAFLGSHLAELDVHFKIFNRIVMERKRLPLTFVSPRLPLPIYMPLEGHRSLRKTAEMSTFVKAVSPKSSLVIRSRWIWWFWVSTLCGLLMDYCRTYHFWILFGEEHSFKV